MVDGTYAKAHQHAAGAARNGLNPNDSQIAERIGRSRGGLTTKLMTVVDNTGRHVRFDVVPGNVGEATTLPNLIADIDTEELIAAKAFDSDHIRLMLASQGIMATIPSRINRKMPVWYDPTRYRTRHLIENFFSDIKQFRGVATRYCKLAESYAAFVKMATWFVETRSTRRPVQRPPFTNLGRMQAKSTLNCLCH